MCIRDRGSFDQGFQFIQEFTGFFTPGIVVIFVLGLFWKRANEAGALAAALGSVLLSAAFFWAQKTGLYLLPFMDRVGIVFLAALVLAVVVSLATARAEGKDFIRTDDVDYRTPGVFNIGAVGVIVILIALYTIFW